MDTDNIQTEDWNSIVLIGKVLNEPEYFYEITDRTYYTIDLKANIKNDKFVILPIVIDDVDYNIASLKKSQMIFVKGTIKTERTNNENEDTKKRILKMYIKPRIIEILDESKVRILNNAIIQGYVCSKVPLKNSQKGVEKLSLLVASNKDDISNYIRCFITGQRAAALKQYEVGERIELHGHIEFNEMREEHQLYVKWCDKTDKGYINKDGYQFGSLV